MSRYGLKTTSSFLCPLSRKQIFAKAFANLSSVVLAFAEPSYFNSPSNYHLRLLAAAQFALQTSKLKRTLTKGRTLEEVLHEHFLSEADEAEVDEEKNQEIEIASARAAERHQTSKVVYTEPYGQDMLQKVVFHGDFVCVSC
eukprot:s610_g16.t1